MSSKELIVRAWAAFNLFITVTKVFKKKPNYICIINQVAPNVAYFQVDEIGSNDNLVGAKRKTIRSSREIVTDRVYVETPLPDSWCTFCTETDAAARHGGVISCHSVMSDYAFTIMLPMQYSWRTIIRTATS